MSTYEQRLNRTLNAVAMKPVDKIPFSYSGSAYLAREQGVKISEYISDFAKATDTAVSFLRAHPGIDSIHSAIMCPDALSTQWLSAVKIPGRELPDDELWQVDEREVITRDDYQAIISDGYGPWVEKVMKERLDDPMSKMMPFIQYNPTAHQRVHGEAGVPIVNSAVIGTPMEYLCGGRTLMNFFIDMYEERTLVKQACDKAHEYLKASYTAQLEHGKPVGAWVGGWRAAPELISHEDWMEFVWPYMKELVYITLERGVVPLLHIDSNWDREIEMFLELPPRSVIIMLDGTTDIRRARRILGDHSCLMGDVPAVKLAYGTADEVYKYTKNLIDDCGPKTGLIVSSGCDVPLNAKPENVNAMIQATVDYI